MSALPDPPGHFGAYGGRFVPETLMPALDELEAAWGEARRDQGNRLGPGRVGRPAWLP